MLKIGDFSKLAQVSVKTLRYYDQLGLLKPSWIDRYSGYRYYTVDQLPRLNRILALKDLGLSLEQIGTLLREDLPVAELRGMLRLKRAELERHLQEEQERIERVEARLKQIEGEGCLPISEVVLKEVPPQQVVGLRTMIPNYGELAKLFHELRAYLQEHRINMQDSYPFQAIYYDPEYRERGADVEAAAPIGIMLPSTDRMSVHELPGVETMASLIHRGSYESLGEAYTMLIAWSENNRYRLAGPSRELYLQSPEDRDDHLSLFTEVQFPVQKKPSVFFLSNDQEINEMNPKIIEKPAFSVVGLKYYGKNTNNEIAQMWDRFNERFEEIPNFTAGCYGLCKPADESGAFEYLAGCAVSRSEDIPEEMQAWDVPAQKYAVFPCTLKTIGETYKYAFETWLPSTDYEYSQGMDFEFYDDDFDPRDPENSILSIYVPIK